VAVGACYGSCVEHSEAAASRLPRFETPGGEALVLHAAIRIHHDPPPKRSGGPAVPHAPIELLFRRYAPYVATIAMRVLGQDAEVDDVVQDVFLAAFRGLGALSDPNATKGWLATVTVRTVRRRLRARRLRGLLRLETAPDYENVAAPGASPEEKALLARVYRVLDGVPANHRIAWTLRHIEGESLMNVAEMCGCSLATAKRWITSTHAIVEKEVEA
jgi:RNA polymerase sigma-70 factor (ECF subfamily)